MAERKDAWEKEQRSIGKYDQLAKVKECRRENPFAAQVHSHILQVTTTDVDKAFQAFFRRVKAGEQPGFPRFRGKGRFASFGLKELGNGFKIDGRRLRVSGIGRLGMRWHRPIEGAIKTLRVVRQTDGWYACFACEVEPQPLPATHGEVGLDVGLHRLLATSDGEQIENPHVGIGRNRSACGSCNGACRGGPRSGEIGAKPLRRFSINISTLPIAARIF